MLSEFPEGWTLNSLAKILQPSLFIDGDWVESKDQSPDGDVRLIQLADIGDGHFIDKSDRHLTKDAAVRLKCTFLKKGDLLVARMPEPLGRCCVFPLDGEERFVTVVDVAVMRPHDNFNSIWLMNLVNSCYARKFIEDNAGGTTRKRISRKNLGGLLLPVPPLKEQHRIAEILSSVDASIQATQAVIEQAERVKRGLMEELLTGGLGSEAIERGEVPEGWDKKPLSDLLSKAYGGGTPSKSEPAYWGGDIYWASVKDMTDFNPLCTKDTITQAGLDNSSSKIVPAGELIFCTRMAVGSTRRYQVDVAINQDLRTLIPSDSLRRDYLYYWLLSKRSEFEDESTGTTVKGLRQERLLAKKLLFPCLNEQKRIAEALSDSDDFIARQKSIVEQQNIIKRGLMDDLLTGKVRTV